MKPQGSQFDKYRHTAHDSNGDREYTLWKNRPANDIDGDARWHAVGNMRVIREPSHAYFSYPDKAGWGTSRQENVVPGNYNQNWMTPTDTPQLFGVHGNEGSNEVHILETTRADRAMAPTMLGIAELESIRDTGKGLTPSTDLSDHSNRMVNKLAERGAVKDWYGREYENDMDFMTYTHSISPEAFDRHWAKSQVPDANVRAGKSIVRNILRGKKPGSQLAGYEQPPLF